VAGGLRPGRNTLYPNLIIAGTNKSGTTSLFRYLSAHPDVCASAIKEVRHFTGRANPLSPECLQKYAAQFSRCGDALLRLEASPDYLSGGRDVATAIHQLLPDVKLVFILREPAARLVSGYRRRKSRDDAGLKDLDLQGYLDRLTSQHEQGAMPGDIRSVCYAELLRDWLAVFPSQQVTVRFFDDLQRDSREFVKEICKFAGIDACFYDDYEFSIENRTRAVRFRAVHKLVHRMNMTAEPLFNRMPAVRKVLRGTYNALNVSGKPRDDETADLGPLRALLAEDRQQLQALLADAYPGLDLPDWVTGSEAAVR